MSYKFIFALAIDKLSFILFNFIFLTSLTQLNNCFL
nr:MAG TPA: Neurotransmitter-gated ion-channel transmembrane region [Caudoviricetes sp.]